MMKNSPDRGDGAKDLKVGGSALYAIGGLSVVIKPITLGKLKRAMAAFQKKNADAFDMMLDYLVETLDNGENNFATRQWLADNVTLPIASAIIDDMRVINGLGDTGFFRKGAAVNGTETRDLIEKTPTP